MDTQNLNNGSNQDPSPLQANKETLQHLLRDFTAKVTFNKKDGTERVMLCTLQQGIAIPHEKKTDRVKEPKPDLLPVWDIEAAAWRTITIANIKHIEITQ